MKFILIYIFVLFLFHHQILAEVDNREWWKHTEIYEVFISSFKDSNGDGIGDFNGITMMLDHFVEMGVGTLWLTPYLKSPMLDFGYDVEDWLDFNPMYGNLDDFLTLTREMKKRGLKLLMDLVLNHSSDRHRWFQLSIKRVFPYVDYYIWRDPKGFTPEGKPILPNNWVSVFGGPAWAWNEERQQWYLHQFLYTQPDLNLKNYHVKEEIKHIMSVWLDRGVTGFRMDATAHYCEDPEFRDEPWRTNPDWYPDKNALRFWHTEHIYTLNLWGSYEVLHDLRMFIEDVNHRLTGDERVLVVEAYCDRNSTMAYYGTPEYLISHFPFNFDIAVLYHFPKAEEFDGFFREWMTLMPAGGTANWVAENHDRHRIAGRFNEEYMDVITTFVMVLPGVACIYYGQEIGMTEYPIRRDQWKDVNCLGGPDGNRDRSRLPMQWDDTHNAGFTSKWEPWLPVHPNYWRVNVKSQKKDASSRLSMFKDLSVLRKTPTLMYGDFDSFVLSTWVYAFTRSYPGHGTILVVSNLGSEMEIVNLASNIRKLPKKLKVVTASLNAGYKKGDIILSRPAFPRALVMRSFSCIVLTSNLHYPNTYNDTSSILQNIFGVELDE